MGLHSYNAFHTHIKYVSGAGLFSVQSHQNVLNVRERKKKRKYIYKTTIIHGHLNSASSLMCPPIMTHNSGVSPLKALGTSNRRSSGSLLA